MSKITNAIVITIFRLRESPVTLPERRSRGPRKKGKFLPRGYLSLEPQRCPPKDRYTCGYQGIHAGWSDDYNSGLEGWWVDITDVLPGDYVLEDTINPDRIVP